MFHLRKRLWNDYLNRCFFQDFISEGYNNHNKKRNHFWCRRKHLVGPFCSFIGDSSLLLNVDTRHQVLPEKGDNVPTNCQKWTKTIERSRKTCSVKNCSKRIQNGVKLGNCNRRKLLNENCSLSCEPQKTVAKPYISLNNSQLDTKWSQNRALLKSEDQKTK